MGNNQDMGWAELFALRDFSFDYVKKNKLLKCEIHYIQKKI